MRTSKAATATTKESIAAMLADKIASKKQSRAKNLAEYTREKAEAKRKIEALQAEQDNADTPGAYKMNAEQIHEQEDYIKFLDKRAQVVNSTPVISREEYEEIKADLEAENKRVLDASAGAILKAFDDLTALLDEYTKTANDMQSVLELAEKSHFNRTLGGHLWHELREKRPDVNGVYSKMLLTYFNHRANELRK